MTCKKGHDSERNKSGHCEECERLYFREYNKRPKRVAYLKAWRKKK